MASGVNIAFPSRPVSPAFSVKKVFVGRCDAMRGSGSLADLFDVERNPATILSHHFAELGEQCLFWSANICFFESPSLGNSAATVFSGMPSGSSSGQQTSGESGIEASTSLGSSASPVLSVPKSAGIVEGVEISSKDEMMLDQQLMTAFQAGLRHSLDDPDHDAMSDL